ncbi:MAG: glycosyltransferase family 9 protein [Nitrospinae bacterium]|nr:glycosyltransferase family 9 protein [Nitrospinota bacterium]
MKNILILNLTRMGDLLQTTPLIAGLKEKYPDLKITLLANKNFSEICNDVPFIDEIYTFDIKQFAPKSEGEEVSLFQVYRYMDELVEQMKSKRFDTVINLSHSKLTAIFTSLLNVPDVRGLTSTDYGHRVIRHPWLNYFCNIIFNRHYNRFNLVDIYMKSGDIQPSGKRLYLNVAEDGLSFANEFLQKNGIKDSDMLIGFQPASSRPDRRWSPDSFARLGLELIKRYGAKIIIFGVSSEKELGDEVQAKINNPLDPPLLRGTNPLNPPFLKGELKGVINVVGKTSVRELAALIKRCNILITNDTGTMHIAAALGTKIAALFFAHALVHETGPYGEGHIILQADIPCSPCSHHTNCKNPVCKDYITVEDVLAAVEIIMKQDARNKMQDIRYKVQYNLSCLLPLASCLFSRVKPFYSSFDADNMVEFLPLIKKPAGLSDIVGYAYRAMWKKVLGSDGRLNILQPSAFKLQAKEIAEKIKNHFDVRSGELNPHGFASLTASLHNVLDSFDRLAKLGREGASVTKNIIKEVSKTIIPPYPPLEKGGRGGFDVEYVKEMGGRINDIDENINLLGMTEQASGPMVSLFKFGKENLQGDNVLKLAEDTLPLYDAITAEAGIMRELLEDISEELIGTKT